MSYCERTNQCNAEQVSGCETGRRLVVSGRRKNPQVEPRITTTWLKHFFYRDTAPFNGGDTAPRNFRLYDVTVDPNMSWRLTFASVSSQRRNERIFDQKLLLQVVNRGDETCCFCKPTELNIISNICFLCWFKKTAQTEVPSSPQPGGSVFTKK